MQSLRDAVNKSVFAAPSVSIRGIAQRVNMSPPIPISALINNLVPPASIGPLQTGSITFDNGVPVGGSSDVTLWPDGSYVFEGHFRDSGFPSFNDALVFVVKDNLTNTAYTFVHSGHMAGTVESGSRDDNWNIQSRSADLQRAWGNFVAGWNWHWEADVNADWNSVVDKALAAVGTVTGVVSVVVPKAAGV